MIQYILVSRRQPFIVLFLERRTYGAAIVLLMYGVDDLHMFPCLFQFELPFVWGL